MAKDPAALLYIDTWKVATTEMSAICRAYYMDLILHQYDKGSLPNDIEELANICRVRFSEFKQFEQVFEQVLKHKFLQNDSGRLENSFASEIIKKREKFLNKRSLSGKISYVVRFAIKNLKANKKQIEYLKHSLDFESLDLKNEQVLKQVLEQKLELYINGDGDGNKNIDINEREKNFKTKVFEFSTKYSDQTLNEFFNYWSQHSEKDKKMLFEKKDSFEISKRLITWSKNEKRYQSPKANKSSNSRSEKTNIPTGNIKTEWD